MASPEEVVRTYLTALKDPSALRDDSTIAGLEKQIADAEDEIARLKLRQQLIDAQSPSLEHFEEDFITHAKAWADEHGVGAEAFASEGVPTGVLRRAGFSVGRGGRARGRSRGPGRARPRTRVTSEEVRAAIPSGAFTIKALQERSGASPAVVRKVVTQALEEGYISEQGPDPDHRGPGRSPTLYKR